MAEINITGNTNQVAQDLESIKGSIQEINDSTESGKKDVKETSNEWTELNSKIEVGQKFITGIFDTVMGVYEKTKDMVKEYEKINNQMTILKSQNVWGDISVQFDRLEKATGGVVDKLDILESVNKAVSFGIDLSGDKLLKLVDVAGKAALNMGVDLKFAFDSLIVGTARESKMILDNLGVMVSLEDANEKYANSIGKTVDALTEEEQKTALLNNVLSELDRTQKGISDDSLMTAGTGMFNKMSRVWRDIKLEIGGDVSDIITYFDEIGMDGVEKAKKHWNQAVAEEQAATKVLLAERVQAAVDIEGEVSDARRKELETIVSSENKYMTMIDDINKNVMVDRNAIILLNDRHNDSIRASTKIWNENQKEYHTLNAIEEVYGEKQRARYELLIEQEKKRLQISKNRGQVSEDTEFVLDDYLTKQSATMDQMVTKSALYLLHFQEISTLFASLKGTDVAETPDIRGEGTDETLKMFEAQTIKTKKISADSRMKNLQKSLDDEEKANEQSRKNYATGLKQQASLIEDSYAREIELARVKSIEISNQQKTYLETTTDTERLKTTKLQEFALKQYQIKLDLNTSLEKIDESADKWREKNNEDIMKTIEDQDKTDKDEKKKQAAKDLEFEKKMGEARMAIIQQNKSLEEKIKEEDKKKQEMDIKEREQIAKMGYAVLSSASNTFYQSMLDEQDDVLQRVAAMALQQAGSQIFADGIERMWKGGGDMLKFSKPEVQAEGATQFAYGVAEVAGGLALGYAGQKMMPNTGSGSSESKSKETASSDRINNNNSGRDQMQVYLYPSQKYYLRTHNNANKKLGYKK